ncbi:MAG TPA: hypothetical protein VD907_01275 [Verrucomicrobiae bacterium]|nr:hypothetical protein [Verrucomicrobiae bacterium]
MGLLNLSPPKNIRFVDKNGNVFAIPDSCWHFIGYSSTDTSDPMQRWLVMKPRTIYSTEGIVIADLPGPNCELVLHGWPRGIRARTYNEARGY